MRTESSNGNVGQKRIGNGGRLQRRVLVNDCRHSERCKFFVVAYILHIYDPREGGRGKVGSLATVRIGESFSIHERLPDVSYYRVRKSNFKSVCFAVLVS